RGFLASGQVDGAFQNGAQLVEARNAFGADPGLVGLLRAAMRTPEVPDATDRIRIAGRIRPGAHLQRPDVETGQALDDVELDIDAHFLPHLYDHLRGRQGVEIIVRLG